MFDRKELRSTIHKWNVAAVGARLIVCRVSAFWIGRFPIAQDPIELVLAGATLAVAQVGGRLFNAISRTARRWVSGIGADADAAEVMSTRR